MKLVTFLPLTVPGATPRLGAWHDMTVDTTVVPRIVDLQAAWQVQHGARYPAFDNMLAWLDAGGEAFDRAANLLERLSSFDESDTAQSVLYAPDDIRLLAPLPRPRSIRDCMSFEQHLVNCTRTALKWRGRVAVGLDRLNRACGGRGLAPVPRVWYERPVYYKGNPHSVVGPDAVIEWPHYTRRLDYELEFGVVIGRAGRDIRASQAAEHIAGYLIFNDFSARDVQLKEMAARLGPSKGKDFDTGNALGPWLVTPDEVPDPYTLTMQARVNGERWSLGTSAGMHHRFADTLAFISQSETLYPGDFIAAGTVPTGCGLELDRWLQPGDVVELEVDRLGVLRNTIGGPVSRP